jgi:hypothetical protein
MSYSRLVLLSKPRAAAEPETAREPPRKPGDDLAEVQHARHVIPKQSCFSFTSYININNNILEARSHHLLS